MSMFPSPPISISGHTIQTLTSTDIPALAAFVQVSRLQLAINRFLFENWPNEAAQHAHNLHAITANFHNPLVSRYKVVNDAAGTMVVHLIMTKLIKQKEEHSTSIFSGKHSQPRISDGMNREVHDTVMKAITYINEAVEDTDRLELTHIYVCPSSRGQGIGAHLVRLAAQLAQEENVPLTLAAEPQAHAFFLKQGLRDTRYFDIDLSKWAAGYCGFGVFRIWGMRM